MTSRGAWTALLLQLIASGLAFDRRPSFRKGRHEIGFALAVKALLVRAETGDVVLHFSAQIAGRRNRLHPRYLDIRRIGCLALAGWHQLDPALGRTAFELRLRASDRLNERHGLRDP